jgi:hypothetical protein
MLEPAPATDEPRLAEHSGGFVRGPQGRTHSERSGARSRPGLPLSRGTAITPRRVQAASDESTRILPCRLGGLPRRPDHEGRSFHATSNPFTSILRRWASRGGDRLGQPCGTGDPACDLAPAWQVVRQPEARVIFRQMTGADEATWRRGKGWAPARR